MIVKANSSDELYQSLFDKANKLLGYETEDVKIHNIAEYFAEFRNIIDACEAKEHSVNPIYLILPADEDFFEIDANKRLVTVPAIFQKNGASVVGDETAEILYFTIDRYFDVMDFASQDMKIEIQAKLPSGEELLYKAYNITAEYPRQEGKLVFGWPLDAACTKSKGNIQFSVRFFKEENGVLTYSFNTLTTQIKINESLNFDVTDTTIEVIDKSKIIRDRIQNSPLVNVLPASKPSFAKIKKRENDDSMIKASTGEYIATMNNRLYSKAWFLEEELIEGKQRGTDFRYIWQFAPFGSDQFNTMDNAQTSYFLTGDGVYDERDRYYYANGEIYKGEQAKFDEERSALYEKFSSVPYEDAGVYSAKAQNIAGRGSQADSDIVQYIVPGAAEIEATIDGFKNDLTEEIPTKIHLSYSKIHEEDKLGEIGEIIATWYKDDEGIALEKLEDNYYKVSDEGWYKCVLKNTLNNTEFDSEPSNLCRVTYLPSLFIEGDIELSANPPIQSGVTETTISIKEQELLQKPARSDEIKYQWVEQIGQQTIDLEGETNSTLFINRPGYYACRLTNIYNNRASEAKLTESLHL